MDGTQLQRLAAIALSAAFALVIAAPAQARVYVGTGVEQDCEDASRCLVDLEVQIAVFGTAPALEIVFQKRPVGSSGGFSGDRYQVTLSGTAYSGSDGFHDISGNICTNAISGEGVETVGSFDRFSFFAATCVEDCEGTDGLPAECQDVEDPAKAPPVRWIDPTGGSWNDPDNWEGGVVPGKRADVSAVGSYTITGVPAVVLDSVSVGNAAGAITLDPVVATFAPRRLEVDGGLLLLNGVFEAGFGALATTGVAVSLRPGARLELRSDATLRTGPDIVDPNRVGEALPVSGFLLLDGIDDTLTVSDGSLVSASQLVVAGTPNSVGSRITIRDPGSRIETRSFTGPTQAPGGNLNLFVESGGELWIGDRLALGLAAGSLANAAVRAGSAILGLRGDLLDTGPRDLVLGEDGDAELLVDGGDLLLGQRLTLGNGSAGSGLLTVRNGGTLFTSTTELTQITVGGDGDGELRIEAGGVLGQLGPASSVLPDLALGIGRGSRGLFDMAGDGDPATVTRFENAVVGVGGNATWLLHDAAQVRMATLGIGLALGSSSVFASVGIRGAGTVLEVVDGAGAQIGVDGDAFFAVRDGALFRSKRLDPGAPAEGDLTTIGSGQSGFATDFAVTENATAEFGTLSIGEDSLAPTLTGLPVDAAGSVRVESGGRVFADNAIRIGNSGRLDAIAAQIETPSLVLGPSDDGGNGALLDLSAVSTLQVTQAISIGTGVPADQMSELYFRDGSNVLAGGLDARGDTRIEISDAFARFDGPVEIGTQAPILGNGSQGTSFVELRVEGDDGVLDASGHEIRIGAGATGCTCIGQLVLANGATAIVDTVFVQAGGFVMGNRGTLRAATRVINGGFIAPGLSPGTLKIIGDVIFEPGSVLALEVGGTEAGSSYDVLEVEGSLSVGGAVTLRFVDGFAPKQDDRFEFLRSTGGFTLEAEEVSVENLAPGFEFDIEFGSDSITVTALNDGVYVPEPAAAACAVGALAALVLLAHRRR